MLKLTSHVQIEDTKWLSYITLILQVGLYLGLWSIALWKQQRVRVP